MGRFVAEYDSINRYAQFRIQDNEAKIIRIDIDPSIDKVSIIVKNINSDEIANYIFRNLSEFAILSTKSTCSRFMLTKQNSIIKVEIKPIFKIEYVDILEE